MAPSHPEPFGAPETWITKAGIALSTSDLSDSHLTNAIHYLSGLATGLRVKLAELEAEAKKRGLLVPNVGDSSPLPAVMCQEEMDIIADLEERSKL